ncbi:putative glycerophosphodiester phosphodiesterase, protein kinase RLK-Pelle-LRK10L-2 family [Helianthus annuus]|uniref:non-specific serine/threonine protein kinase n=1 Tax=Helianthus annuus TaxID=4232 RepID=A0A9K3HLC8_HELAN|nr:putative glycerophosphodiester phosphodiesterase, protein kinase RLK-Pelle-LRK10L-2 family [Helianthus annuus]
MKPLLGPTPALLAITVVLATIISFPVARCQDTSPYDICRQSVQCGDIDKIEYPFWLSGRPQHCGRPDFQLSCRSDIPMLRLGPVDYRVLKTDSSIHTVTVARNDLWTNLCPQTLYNTTYNTTLFNGNNFGQEDVSLYYGCQGILGVNPLAASFRFSCDFNQTQSDNYFYRTSLINTDTTISSILVQCNSHITVPVDQSWVNRILNATESELKQAMQDGFNLRWTAYNEECDQCVRSGGRCGSSSTSPDQFVCYCASGNFSATCNSVSVDSGGDAGDSKSNSLGIVLAIVGAVIVVFVVVIGCRIFVSRQRRKRHTIKERSKLVRLPVTTEGPEAANDNIEIFIRNYGNLAPKRYKYSEIEKMTNSFLEKLGHGGYGSLLSEATGDGEDFINEVASIGRTSHVNIVTLLGFCFEGKKRALLYKFMPNGSLDKFLRGDGSHLDWKTLFQIAKGIARGLEYLHKGCNTRIVHFDIKPHNILLDEEFVPKISDFGLAKLCKTKESIVSVMGARGTAGYMAPEVFFKSLGGASHKSDVYSYGMMVLEMTGARKHNNTSGTSTSEAYFPDWVYKQVEVGGDLGDYGVTSEEEEELARKMMIVSLWCIQSNPSDRPSISKVVEMLEGSFEILHVPPRRFESSPARPFQVTSSSSMQSSSGEIVSAVSAGKDFFT